MIAAAYIASHVRSIKIALLGPIVPQSNPVLLAEEMVMLDTMAEGRLIVGMLRGTTNEMLTYDLNPEESRERTDEGMELILRAWKEPQPFGWQGRHFHNRTVSVWPKPLQQPLPPMYALGTSREASDFAARNHVGLDWTVPVLLQGQARESAWGSQSVSTKMGAAIGRGEYPQRSPCLG